MSYWNIYFILQKWQMFNLYIIRSREMYLFEIWKKVINFTNDQLAKKNPYIGCI